MWNGGTSPKEPSASALPSATSGVPGAGTQHWSGAVNVPEHEPMVVNVSTEPQLEWMRDRRDGPFDTRADLLSAQFWWAY